MTNGTATYNIGGGWGNAIQWLNKTQFDEPNTHFQVVGWKSRKPRIGDFLLGKFQRGTAKFQFTKIEPQGDPPDMFFGEVALIGYTDEIPDQSA